VNSRVTLITIVGFGLMLGGCKRQEPPSPIVKEVQDAGAGDLSTESEETIEKWFVEHEKLAIHVRDECSAIKANKPADWSVTTEGRICTAATKAVFKNSEPIKTDERKF
jgi:hypothetical protein